MKITTQELKSLNETVSSIAATNNDRNLAEGYINSLTEKARQIASKKMEDEEEKEEEGEEEEMEDEDEDEMEEMPPSKKKKSMAEETHGNKPSGGDSVEEIMKRLAARALKKAKKKSRGSSESDYAGAKPKAASYDPDMKNTGAVAEEIELAEKAAPGYEDWASDPKVKASFKKQYGKRWKQVMYAKSWKMSKMDEETEQLDEISDTLLFRARAKAKGVGKFKVRTNPSFAGSSKDIPLHKKITQELQRRGSVPLGEETELDEGYQAKRLRIMRKALGRRSLLSPKLDDYMKRSFKKKEQRNKQISGGKGNWSAAQTRADKKIAAMKAKGLDPLAEEMQLDEGIVATLLNKIKGKGKSVPPIGRKLKNRKRPGTPTAGSKMVATKLSEEELEEGYQAKRMRIIRKAIAKKDEQGLKPEVSDFMKRSFKKKRKRMERFAGSPSMVVAMNVSAAKKQAAMKAKGLAEGMQLDEAGYKKLMRVKGAAYKAELASRGADPNTSLKGLVKAAKLKRASAEQTAKVAARMASRGGASTEAVKAGGSRIGKKGKYTQKAGKLANMRDRALARFRSTAKIARYQETGDFDGKLGKEGVAKKREMQKGMAKFRMDARHGDFGHEISPESKKSSMRARYNYEKKYGRLKGK